MSRQDETPLMQQWREAKARHPDALVFFRVGDFYEMFFQDAEDGARLLGLTLTTRNNGAAAQVPLAGVPVRARDEYIERLLRLGRRVAICEQMEDPAEARGIVRREVIETITPGAVLADSLLSERKNNFLVALVEAGGAAGAAGAGGVEGSAFALAAADVSTGELVATTAPPGELEPELARFEPAELLLPQSWAEPAAPLAARALSALGARLTFRPDWLFDPTVAAAELRRHFRVQALDGFGFQDGDEPLLATLGALLAYLNEVQSAGAANLRPPRLERPGAAMALDEMTRRNLELLEPLRPDASSRGTRQPGTLLDVVDETLTPMGARLLRRWLLRPLVLADSIWRRQESVAELFEQPALRRRVRAELKGVRDLERLAAKVGAARVSPRELKALGDSLEPLPALQALLAGAASPLLAELAEGLDALEDVRDLVRAALVDDPPAALTDGGVIRPGHDAELDELRGVRDGAREFIASLQARERARTGIASLKVGYNKVFGYYLEVTRSNFERVPEVYERKQTLAHAERFVTPELKEWEAKVLGAEERILEVEARLFAELRRRVAAEAARLQDTARRVAVLDVLAGLAQVAERRAYVRPVVHTGYGLEVTAGRHPVVETMMPREEFIPNDVVLDEEARIMILTGPNMAGKSTLLRQVGLIQLLAQVGSFVPAAAARLPVCDRIFTRVGASDNLVRGASTFMVEMNETAAILHGATRDSLVLLDEIGRGTATYDGVSIAWAVTEHLHERIGARTIFATHYHELTQLADLLPALVNYNVAVKEVGDEVIFLRRLERGGADRSYGIQVARLAGVPRSVVQRAAEILRDLEGAHSGGAVGLGRLGRRAGSAAAAADQLSLFLPADPPVLDRLRRLELERLTPLEALNLLAELQAEARGGAGGGR
ncbi:MAG: DNA mismatch repair protein MutS [Gemmatimonadetes bacterium]|nr:DNA mismatch repair protein MutS [Gemmatimonadota bacterium]